MDEAAGRVRGVLLMIAAVGAFAIMDAFMKGLTERYAPLQIACLRGASSVPFIFVTYLATGRLRLLRPARWAMHVVRALLAVLMLWAFVWALARSSIADTYAIYMTTPLLVVLCASLLLGEKVQLPVWIAILTGLAGALFMLKPGTAGIASLAGLAALGSALAYALIVVLVRHMARTETTGAMVFWYLLMVALGAGALAAPGWVAIVATDWPWIAAIGLSGWAGQHLLTEAFRLAPATVVAPYEYMALVWAMAIDWLFWHTLPGARMLTGAAVVIGAGLYLLHRQRR